MDFEENKKFNYCVKVDLHALDDSVQLDSVVAIASEHGFRGIVVGLNRIEELVGLINDPIFGDKSIKPICAIDYPLGVSSLDVRNYCIMSAKEKGAKEVEIVAAYNLFYDKNFRRATQDVQSILDTSKKAGIGLKYIIDKNSKAVSDNIQTRIIRMISNNKIPVVSNSVGLTEKITNHSDEIIRIRNIKNKSSCQVKMYIPNCGVDDLASYTKAGVDIVGLDWNKAPCIVHAYEEIVEKGA